MKRSTLLTAVLLLFCLIFTSSALGASYADTYGMSPKGMAMGNAMTAHVNDWSSVYYNVAGLGRTNHIRLAKDKPAPVQLFAGYLYTSPQTDLDIPARYSDGTYYDTNADNDLNYGAFMLGATLDLNAFYDLESIPPNLLSSCRLGVGLGINDDLSVAKVSDLEPQTHNYLRYGRESQQLLVMTGLGLGFMDDLFGVGFGIRSSFGGDSRIALQEVDFTTEPERPLEQAYMDLKLESAFTAGFYVDMDQLDIGFSWRQETKMKIDPLQTVAVTTVGDIPLNLQLSILDYYQPNSYTAGVSYQINDKVMVAFDVEYQTWSGYEVSSNLLYNEGAILPKLDDIWIPKLGLQYKANEKTDLYFGYYYQPSFIPDEAVTGEVNWLDNDKHVGSIGVSYNFGKPWAFKVPVELDFGYQFQYLEDRTVTKTAPTGMNPSYSYGGTVHTIMMGLSL